MTRFVHSPALTRRSTCLRIPFDAARTCHPAGWEPPNDEGMNCLLCHASFAEEQAAEFVAHILGGCRG